MACLYSLCFKQLETKFSILILFSFQITSGISPPFEAHQNISLKSDFISAIVGGRYSAQRKFFVVVSDQSDKWITLCGGAIIDPHWVLTAAHCVHDTPNPFALISDWSVRGDRKTRIYASKIILHPKHQNMFHTSNDIALMKLSQPVDSEKVLNLCRDDPDSTVQLGACGMGTITKSKYAKVVPEKLVEATFSYTPAKFSTLWCMPEYICVDRIDPDSNICSGDSGGPLYVVSDDTKKPKCLFGVTSFSRDSKLTPDEECNVGSVFQSIPYHFQWIMTVISQEAAQSDT